MVTFANRVSSSRGLTTTNSLDFFQRIKKATDWIPFKDKIGPLYRPIIEKIKYRRDNKRFLAGGKDALIAAKHALDAEGIPFWLDFGTLLGITRDGELIRHDTDVDIAVLNEHFSLKIREALQSAGFKLVCEYLVDDGKEAREECYEFQGVGLDIFYYYRDESHMWCHLFPVGEDGRLVRELRMTWTGFREFPFADLQWQIPGDHHQRLVDTYGETYNIPDPNFYTPDDAHNSRLLDLPCVYKKYDQ